MPASRFRLFWIIILLAVSGATPAASVDEDREYLLRHAAANGELSTVRSLLEQGADVNGANKRGYTALILAVRGGHTYVIKHLVAASAAVKAQDIDGDSPLLLAVSTGNPSVAEILLASGAEAVIRDPRGTTPLMKASALGTTDIVRLLLEKKASPNDRDKDGDTALLIAAKNGHTDVVSLLLAQGADVHQKSAYGDTAYQLAVQYGHPDTAAVLAAQEKQEPAAERKERADEQDTPGLRLAAQSSVVAATAELPAGRVQEIPPVGETARRDEASDRSVSEERRSGMESVLAIIMIIAAVLI